MGQTDAVIVNVRRSRLKIIAVLLCVASAVIFAIVVLYRRSETEVSLRERLSVGDLCIEAMERAAPSRDYDAIVQNYSELREHYIAIADELVNGEQSQTERMQVLRELKKWEDTIRRIRNLKLFEAELELPSIGNEIPEFARLDPDLIEQRIAELGEESRTRRMEFKQKWLRDEERLSKAMSSLDGTRTSNEGNPG